MNHTAVRASFCASHFDSVRQELHGHSYEVIVSWPSEPRRDQVELQAALRDVLRGYDHKTLPEGHGRMEVMAETIGGHLPGCVAVDLARPVEGMYASWRLAADPRNIYRHDFEVRCPNNDAVIPYRLEISSPATIMVEGIVEACRFDGPAYHEDIADLLLHRIGGKQTLRAHHHGVDIETRRGW